MVEETYKVKTSVGTFHVEKTVGRSYSGKLQAEYLHIGATNKCVMFKWIPDAPTKVELQWLNTHKQRCETSGLSIKGKNTVHLFYLAVSILKTYVPVNVIWFQDNSQFPCELPNGEEVNPSLKHMYFLFHGKTWYEDRFGATPMHDDEKRKYDALKGNLTDPAFKPENFSYFNKDIDSRLGPIYDSTSTWKEFFDKVKLINKYCVIVFPWFMYAVREILGNRGVIPDYWKIEIDDDFPTEPYSKVAHGGGTRKRNTLLTHKHVLRLPDTPNYSNLLEMDFGPLVRARQRRH
jgi:hypothetical protein